MSISKEQYKRALQACIKPMLTVILLSILRGFAESLPGSSQRIGGLAVRSYIVMAIVLAVSVYVFRIYAQVKMLIVYWTSRVSSARNLDESLPDRILPIAEKLTLILYLAFTYYYLVPIVKDTGSYFFGLDYGTLSTIFDIGVLSLGLYAVISLWRVSQPIVDHLVGRVSQTVAPSSDLLDTVEAKSAKTDELQCPSCGKSNQPDAKFCIYCGAPLQRTSTELKKDRRLCPKCKSKNPPSAKYCNECGHLLKEKQ